MALVSVVGLGYIGLPTSVLLASAGYVVSGTDIDSTVVATVNKGNAHIVEPDLDLAVKSAVLRRQLKASQTVQSADVYIICVPTPFQIKNGIAAPNLDYVIDATESIAPLVKAGDIVILESTSPVGTTQIVYDVLRGQGLDMSSIYLAYCPERVLPGKIMSELILNDRVIGGINIESTNKVTEFYRTFIKGKILQTDAKTAEMCKLTENSFRDVNIAFANELSIICDKNGVDVWELIALANHHPRVDILQPGTGVGGHCIAVDPWFLVAGDNENSKIIRKAREVNDHKPDWVVSKIVEKVSKSSGSLGKIVCLGLAFKPNIDDLRESPAVSVVEKLLHAGFDVSAIEPNIAHHDSINLVELNQLDSFDVIAILVPHKEFFDPLIISSLAKYGSLDFCGLLSNDRKSI